ncbi:hypothetical protein MMC22_002326 [Lobaria immixta]|nr:hypothetical protein [Lobaria immixta]
MSYEMPENHSHEQELYSEDVPALRPLGLASRDQPLSWYGGDDQVQRQLEAQHVQQHISRSHGRSNQSSPKSVLPEHPPIPPLTQYRASDQPASSHLAPIPTSHTRENTLPRHSAPWSAQDRGMLEAAPQQRWDVPLPPSYNQQNTRQRPSLEGHAYSIDLSNYPSKTDSRVDIAHRGYEDDRMLIKHSGLDYSQNPEATDNMTYSTSPKQPLRKLQKFHRNFFHPRAKYSWATPNSYQLAGQSYTARDHWRHRDAMRRIWNGVEDDRYLNPDNGRVNRLVVQTTNIVYDGPTNSTWRRTYIRNASSIIVRVAQWPFTKVPRDSKQWSRENWTFVGLWWLPTCISLLVVMSLPEDAGGQIRNYGCYDPISYKYWGYPKAARNFCEDMRPEISADRTVPDRILRPRYLCFLEHPDDTSAQQGVKTVLVETWLAEHGAATELNYLFLSYTGLQFDKSSPEDMDALREIGEIATRKAGLQAYWIDLDCMPDKKELEDDVHRISDVVRGAHSLAIAVGPLVGDVEQDGSTHDYLKVWGERMWTWPEVLLAPLGSEILIYTRGLDLNRPLSIDKRNFTSLAWDDASVARQLIDHYEGTLGLSRLELVILGLHCLKNRIGGTKKYCEGDLSYALMGLLRQRPKVDKSDSAFQAFARLSLANDSDMLLERLICILPKDRQGDWSAMDDCWDVKLWDIYPSCQIAGIGEDDTVLIDGAFGASIRWDSFAKVAVITRKTWTRWISRFLVRGAPVWFFTGVLIVSISKGTASPQLAVGVIFLILALITILLSPVLVTHVYGGKLWNTQPWLFGFEGYLDLETIETKIFGFPQDRLSWSPFGSPLSRHEENCGECEGRDPVLSDKKVRDLAQRAVSGNEYPEPKVFTLVDTNTMTVTMFEAVRPPVMALMCGSEGGMQRAVLCSYDWTSQTMYRESVLRMETRVLEKMSRVSKLRFGLKRAIRDTSLTEV